MPGFRIGGGGGHNFPCFQKASSGWTLWFMPWVKLCSDGSESVVRLQLRSMFDNIAVVYDKVNKWTASSTIHGPGGTKEIIQDLQERIKRQILG